MEVFHGNVKWTCFGPGPVGGVVVVVVGTLGCSLHRWFCLRIRLFPTLLSVATQSYQWYSWGPPNMQCRLCASCWTYWKKYGGLKMPTRLDGERPGPNRNNMVSGTCHTCQLLHVGLRSLASSHSAVLGWCAPFHRVPMASQPGAVGAPSLP